MKKSILNSLKQLVLIVFSVVLGILLSEWIAERKQEQEAALLLEKIRSEVQGNQLLLQEWVPYHTAIVAKLDSLTQDPTFVDRFTEDADALFDAVLTRGNLMGSTPSNDAWDIAKSHPLIVHFDYDQLLALTRVYHQQQMTYEPTNRVIELLLSADFNDPVSAERNLMEFRNRMREIESRERQLMGYYVQAMRVLGE